LARRAPYPNGNQIRSSGYIGAMPTLEFPTPQEHHDIALLHQLGSRQWLVSGHPEGPSDLAFEPTVAGICEGRSAGAHLGHPSLISRFTHLSSISFADWPAFLRTRLCLQLIHPKPVTRIGAGLPYASRLPRSSAYSADIFIFVWGTDT
jgi:hypothetical protein